MPLKVTSIDHLVLTVADIKRSLDFYECVVGMRPVTFGDDRHALEFGEQKINLHEAEATFSPKPLTPTAGSADLCFLIEGSAREAVLHLQEQGVAIEQGPVERAGAGGKPLRSVYFRDPDGNLVEVAEVLADTSSSISSP
jgi:catechol 2,3-dioxygenase-like lactoylglutathione lyase family enzyme